jgi:DNA segregation ATPase FtsK/SpoIIIE-like protein
MKNSEHSQQAQSRRPQDPEALIRDILIRAKRTGDDRLPDFANLLTFAVNDPEDTEIIDLLEEQLQASEMAELVDPDPFRVTAPNEYDNMDGDIVLGLTSVGTVYGIDCDSLCRHLLVCGASGSGKTNILRLLVAQIVSREVR